ncbi:hypothetical protein DXG01_008183 [Tephrocybe rancida]|nr:hypothetical protein DXG01_008183 [Tephrocybe rancida]
MDHCALPDLTAGHVAHSLLEYTLEHKIMAIVLDNSSKNATLTDKLVELVPSFCSKEMHVRWFAHILNLVVKAVLSQFAKMKKKDGDNTEEDDDTI